MTDTAYILIDTAVRTGRIPGNPDPPDKFWTYLRQSRPTYISSPFAKETWKRFWYFIKNYPEALISNIHSWFENRRQIRKHPEMAADSFYNKVSSLSTIFPEFLPMGWNIRTLGEILVRGWKGYAPADLYSMDASIVTLLFNMCTDFIEGGYVDYDFDPEKLLSKLKIVQDGLFAYMYASYFVVDGDTAKDLKPYIDKAFVTFREILPGLWY